MCIYILVKKINILRIKLFFKKVKSEYEDGIEFQNLGFFFDF